MIPVTIDASEVWEGGVRRVFSAPDGDLTNPLIAPVEVILDKPHGEGTPIRVCVKLALEPGELNKLAAGGSVWVAMYGGLAPFAVDVKGSGE